MPCQILRKPILFGAALSLLTTLSAQANEPFTFMTNWYAEAEQGGFYQALADGSYASAGLDVTIKMGGAQVNVLQLLAAGKADCVMGASDIEVYKIREQGVPAVTVATSFQQDPQGIVAHPDVKTLGDLQGKTILIASAAHNTFWPWLKSKYGLKDSQVRPYASNLQPFLADSNTALQGYVTYDPYALKKAGAESNFLRFSDQGWPPYANVVICMESTIKNKPDAISAFLKASMTGWKNYLTGDRSAADALIKKDNPQMTDGQIEFAVNALNDQKIVNGGDATTEGIGIITEDRLKQTYDFLVNAKILNPEKVKLQGSYDLRFIQNTKVLP